MNKILSFFISLFLVCSFSFGELPTRPPLPPEIKEAADKIRNLVESGEITHDEARKRHEALIAEFKESLSKPAIENPKDAIDQIHKAVREGEMSKEEAHKKLHAIKEQMAERGEYKRPQRPEKPEISIEIKNQIEQAKELEKVLHAEIKGVIAELGKEATKEDIKKAVEAFKEGNRDKFEAIKEAHAAIRENLKSIKPERPERPELTEELKEKVAVLQEKRKEMHEAQKELHKNLKDASSEEKKELIAAFKEANKEKHEEIKAQAKAVKEDIRALGKLETEATRTSDL